MGTSIGLFFGTFSGRPRDVILPSGYVSVNISMTDKYFHYRHASSCLLGWVKVSKITEM